jgi:cellulose synthase/poly-beta-1,6-N-acetylglucosamine synthase-like glycosyltransferase
MDVVSSVLFLLIGSGIGFLYLLAVASVRSGSRQPNRQPRHTFVLAIPAHNEESVIGATVKRLWEMDYPRRMFDIYVVADHCGDGTARAARAAGAQCLERAEEPRGSKGAALAWAFKQIPELGTSCDAVVVFDADTQADRNFLRVMDARLRRGDTVIQGCHRISNPDDGWFPALTAAMFTVDNRFQNQGRANLGWSAKNMGDSICFRADVLWRMGWGEGLTEDYEFRQKLLLEGFRIAYEPGAIGYGEAAANWRAARAQRMRWLSGTFNASRRYARTLLKEGLRRRNGAMLDGAVQAIMPSYSTLALVSVVSLAAHLLLHAYVSLVLIGLWGAAVLSLVAYPLIGLALERAPLGAYIAISLGPVFIVWRTWLGLVARLGKPVMWVRTARRSGVGVDDRLV